MASNAPFVSEGVSYVLMNAILLHLIPHPLVKLYFCCPVVLRCQYIPLVIPTKGVLPLEFHVEEAAVAPAIVCAVPCPVSGILRFMWCLLLLWLLLKLLVPCPGYQSLSCPLAGSPLVFSEARISQH